MVENKSIKVYTLVLIRNLTERTILLGQKKRGFGVGKWNGFGGKVEANESVIDAAKRELNEECGLRVDDCQLVQVGVLLFEFDGNPQLMQVHIFQSFAYTGTLVESEDTCYSAISIYVIVSEMYPQWFKIDSVPFDCMWPDDRMWWPSMMDSIRFSGYFKYATDEKTIIEYRIEKDEDDFNRLLYDDRH